MTNQKPKHMHWSPPLPEPPPSPEFGDWVNLPSDHRAHGIRDPQRSMFRVVWTPHDVNRPAGSSDLSVYVTSSFGGDAPIMEVFRVSIADLVPLTERQISLIQSLNRGMAS